MAGSSLALERLARLKSTPDCLAYCENVPAGDRRPFVLSIYSACSTAEIFVEMTDGYATRVQSFVSRYRNCPPEVRRKNLPLVDAADAFALARLMTRHWPWKIRRKADEAAAGRTWSRRRRSVK